LGAISWDRFTVTVPRSFHIRRTFLFPLGLLLALCLVLLVVTLIQGQPKAKVLILGCIILPVAILFIESAFRRTVIDENRVTVFKLGRKASLAFADLTALETMMVRKRAFLTLCAGEDFLIISNAYADFPGLVRTLLQRAPAAAITEETRKMAEAPPTKSTDIVSCWLAVGLLALILYLQWVASR
jgi:hypothetical protein